MMADDYVNIMREREQQALDTFSQFLAENRDQLLIVAHLGDGRCGLLLGMMQEALLGPEQPNLRYRKKDIGNTLRTRVFERDRYRCVKCETHLDLTCDHIIPESAGGPTTFENLQTMCRTCNSRKGARP